jgi:hypothetical protein
MRPGNRRKSTLRFLTLVWTRAICVQTAFQAGRRPLDVKKASVPLLIMVSGCPAFHSEPRPWQLEHLMPSSRTHRISDAQCGLSSPTSASTGSDGVPGCRSSLIPERGVLIEMSSFEKDQSRARVWSFGHYRSAPIRFIDPRFLLLDLKVDPMPVPLSADANWRKRSRRLSSRSESWRADGPQRRQFGRLFWPTERVDPTHNLRGISTIGICTRAVRKACL